MVLQTSWFGFYSDITSPQTTSNSIGKHHTDDEPWNVLRPEVQVVFCPQHPADDWTADWLLLSHFAIETTLVLSRTAGQICSCQHFTKNLCLII